MYQDSAFTLNGFGVLLNLASSCPCSNIPNNDLACGIGRCQAQRIGRTNVMVIIFPGPFHLWKLKQIVKLDETRYRYCQNSALSNLPFFGSSIIQQNLIQTFQLSVVPIMNTTGCRTKTHALHNYCPFKSIRENIPQEAEYLYTIIPIRKHEWTSKYFH